MIKVLLKHWLFEFCIDTIFNNINKNFMEINGTRDKLLQIYYGLMKNYMQSKGMGCYTYKYFLNERKNDSLLDLVIDIDSMMTIMECDIRYDEDAD